MWKMTSFAALLLGSLAGCAGGSGGSGKVPVATGTTFEQQLVSAAGLGDFSQVPAEQISRDGANVSTAALTGLTAINPVGGMTSFSSLGMGVLMFLASPPKSAASYDQTLGLYPADWDSARIERHIQDRLTASVSATVEAAGFKPTESSKYPGQRVWVRDGCNLDSRLWKEDCFQEFRVYAVPKGIVSGKRAYNLSSVSGSMFREPTLNSVDGDFSGPRNAISKLPGEVFLYVSPKQTAEGWSEPFVVGPSGAKPLVR
jgi:hypothetical protein